MINKKRRFLLFLLLAFYVSSRTESQSNATIGIGKLQVVGSGVNNSSEVYFTSADTVCSWTPKSFAISRKKFSKRLLLLEPVD